MVCFVELQNHTNIMFLSNTSFPSPAFSYISRSKFQLTSHGAQPLRLLRLWVPYHAARENVNPIWENWQKNIDLNIDTDNFYHQFRILSEFDQRNL